MEWGRWKGRDNFWQVFHTKLVFSYWQLIEIRNMEILKKKIAQGYGVRIIMNM